MLVFVEILEILNFCHELLFLTFPSKSFRATFLFKKMHLIAVSALHGLTVIPMLFLKLADCVFTLKSMSLLHDHFTILILLVEAILASLVSGPFLLEFFLKLTILLGELLFADLVVAKLSRQAGSEVVSLALNHSHLIVEFVNSVLHVPGVARQLDSKLLNRGLLLADHSFLLLQLIVEQAFKLAVVALSGNISTWAVGRLVAFGGRNGDTAEVEGIFGGR